MHHTQAFSHTGDIFLFFTADTDVVSETVSGLSIHDSAQSRLPESLSTAGLSVNTIVHMCNKVPTLIGQQPEPGTGVTSYSLSSVSLIEEDTSCWLLFDAGIEVLYTAAVEEVQQMCHNTVQFTVTATVRFLNQPVDCDVATGTLRLHRSS